MSKVFDHMVSDLTELADMRAYAEAQFKTITELNKKLKVLEEEKNHLKKILEQTTPLLQEDKKEIIDLSIGISAEEMICLRQLNLLKEVSIERELTLEETRRVEIFSKILANIRNSPKAIKPEAKALTEKELIALIDDSDESTTKSSH